MVKHVAGGLAASPRATCFTTPCRLRERFYARYPRSHGMMKFHHLYFRRNLGDAVLRHPSRASESHMAVRLTHDQGEITPNFTRCDSDFTAWDPITLHWPVCQPCFLTMTRSLLCSSAYKQSCRTIDTKIFSTGHEQSPCVSFSACFANDVRIFFFARIRSFKIK